MSGTAIILGSGTSNGVPTLGIEYPEEFLANPKNHRTRCSVLLQGPEGNVLVDCAPEMRIQMVRENILDIEAVLITHTHADHVMGMDDIRAFCLKYEKPIPVYTSPQYQEDIKRIFPYAFQQFPKGIWVPRMDLRDAPEWIEHGGMKIRTFWVEHGQIPCMGLRVNNFAYITDVSHIPADVMPLLEGLDVLVLDAVRLRPHPNHFHFEKSLEVAQEIGAKMTYFTHLCDDYDHDKTELTLPPQIRLAFDGLRIPL
ncbi:MAG: MBL fold metallo-hydrolase [Armatimonadetes bacterium]|nr:MBL fold metallo-hydrolase [Armatimonadota bacterium]